MAAGLFLVTRTSQGVTQDRNLVREVIIHDDDGDTDAVIIAQCITQLNALFPTETKGGDADAEPAYPAGYFDTVIQIAATPEGPLATINDMIAYAPEVSSNKT